ncbi:hypothetical protein D3C75_921690 [compost metagenome]
MLPEPPIRATPAVMYQSISVDAMLEDQIITPSATVTAEATAVNRPRINRMPIAISAKTIKNWDTVASAVYPPSEV